LSQTVTNITPPPLWQSSRAHNSEMCWSLGLTSVSHTATLFCRLHVWSFILIERRVNVIRPTNLFHEGYTCLPLAYCLPPYFDLAYCVPPFFFGLAYLNNKNNHFCVSFYKKKINDSMLQAHVQPFLQT